MIKYNYIILSVLNIILFYWSNPVCCKIVIHSGKYSNYYHLKYRLEKDNFNMSMGKRSSNFSNEDGQFEIFLDKRKFPIKSPQCKSKLVLRMPSTLSSNKYSQQSILEKKKLYEKIDRVFKGEDKEIDVIIELNPYIKLKSEDPLELELKNCNIFFRTKNNSYFDSLD